MLISNLRQRGSVRLFATVMRGEYGMTSDVEISGVAVTEGELPCMGFTIRDVSRRLAGEPRTGREMPHSVGQMTELVGRVPLKDIVRDTTDLIEQLCIEAALELTARQPRLGRRNARPLAAEPVREAAPLQHRRPDRGTDRGVGGGAAGPGLAP